MNTALITTTIHVPHVLAAYRAIGPDVEIIVAGDVTGPQDEIAAFCTGIGARYLSYEEQGRLGYAVHELIGPRCIQRRNIALLEAIRSGAEVIISIDTDNAPVDDVFFLTMEHLLSGRRWQLMPLDMDLDVPWFNPGAYADVPYSYRGFPYSLRAGGAEPQTMNFVWNIVDVGIANGLVLGDPDINATERIERAPVVTRYHDHAETGIALNPSRCWAPINTQSTGYRRELAPLAACPPGLGRYDDILGSFIAQRVMQATPYHVHYGQPFVRQDRHPHNLIGDLTQELYGMTFTEQFADILRAAPVRQDAAVLDNLVAVYSHLIQHATFLPEPTVRFMNAWVDDVAGVL